VDTHTSKNTHVCVISTRVLGMIFAQLSINIEGQVGFITADSNCDGRSRDVAMVTDLCRVSAKINTPRLHFVRWHFTTVGKIAKWIWYFHS